MSKVWRIVAWLTAALVGLGLVLMGAGWLTGASVPRMASMLFGSRAAALEAYYGLLNQAMALPGEIIGFVSSWF